MSMSGTFPTRGSASPWDFGQPDCKSQAACLVVGAVLTALAAVATYYCLMNGLQRIDFASTTLLKFQAGALIYAGVAFSVVAVGNALYTGKKLLLDDSHKFNYDPSKAKTQIAISLLAPIAVIPGIIVCALGGALAGHR